MTVNGGEAMAGEAIGADQVAERPRGRDSLFLMANLRLPGDAEPFAVRVRNLSSGGLMAELPEPIEADAPVSVEVRGLGWIAGRVVWQTEGRAGIAFDKPIDPQRARKPVSGAAVSGPQRFARAVR